MKDIEERLKEYVSWKSFSVFMVIISLATTVFMGIVGWLVWQDRATSEDILNASVSRGDLQTQIGSMKTDIEWIKNTINRSLNYNGAFIILERNVADKTGI